MNPFSQRLRQVCFALLTLCFGIGQASAATLYVSLQSTNPIAPYADWTTAATNIQDAVSVAQPGDTVLATNGYYTNGGVVVFGLETNRVALTNPVTLLSVNGPGFTTIAGGLQTRCAYVGTNAVLSGFTLTNGQARLTGDVVHEQSGGGAWCESNGVMVNCLVVSNFAGSVGNTSTARLGGGVYGGTISNCVLSANFGGSGGGAAAATLWNCTLSNNIGTLGGGAYGSSLFNCSLASNTAAYNGTPGSGGGIYQCIASNCTLTGNQSASFGGGSYQSVDQNCVIAGNNATFGGGTYQGTNSSCTISSNSASGIGGGAELGLLYNCLVYGNKATNQNPGDGGGVATSMSVNCTIVSNAATGGGGCYGGTNINCIIYFNSALSGSNYAGSSLFYCCSTPSGGATCITNNPLFVDAAHNIWRLNCNSPCIDKGTGNPMFGVTMPTNDIRGLPRPINSTSAVQAAYDMGAYEYDFPVDAVPTISAAYTNAVTNFTLYFSGEVDGCANSYTWDFGDGVTVNNQNSVSHAWATPGIYNVQLTGFFSGATPSVTATTQVQIVKQPIYYANIGNHAPVFPYTNLASAATNIQAAIDAGTVPGRLVIVSPGNYTHEPARVTHGSLSNCIVLTNGVTVLASNSPVGGQTIQPSTVPVRVAYVGSNSVLSGFSLRGGQTLSSGDPVQDMSGGGVFCEPGGVVSNCGIASSSSTSNGGGAYGGTLYNCTITGNNSHGNGGGAYLATLYNCTIRNNSALGSGLGGGVDACAVYNSAIFTNSSSTAGGGAAASALYNCVILNNTASMGGGCYSNTLCNCTVVGNFATGFFGSGGGGVCFDTITNCIVYFNAGEDSRSNWSGGVIDHSCTYPLAPGGGNITNAPIFLSLAGANLHLHFGSPGIDAGADLSAVITNDLDGVARPLDGDGDGVAAFDMGAYEFNLLATVGASWLTSHGLNPNDPNVFASHPNGNPWSVLQSWIADTDPNVYTPLVVTASNVLPPTVSFNGSANRVYALQSSSNLMSGWTPVSGQSGIPGAGGTTTLQDTNAAGMEFYRVVVSVP